MNEASADTPVANDTAVLDEVMVEHPHGDRFLVQRGIFRSMSPKVPEAMYVVTKGDALVDRHSLTLGEAATASTNTYFGRFAAVSGSGGRV